MLLFFRVNDINRLLTTGNRLVIVQNIHLVYNKIGTQMRNVNDYLVGGNHGQNIQFPEVNTE